VDVIASVVRNRSPQTPALSRFDSHLSRWHQCCVFAFMRLNLIVAVVCSAIAVYCFYYAFKKGDRG
jgi:hypothetical protein